MPITRLAGRKNGWYGIFSSNDSGIYSLLSKHGRCIIGQSAKISALPRSDRQCLFILDGRAIFPSWWECSNREPMFIDTGPSAAGRCGDCLSRKIGWGSALLCGRATGPKDLVLPVGHIVKSYFYTCILAGMHAFVFLVPSGQKESCPWPKAYLQQQWAPSRGRSGFPCIEIR